MHVMAAVTMAQMFAFGGTPRVANSATPPRGELSSHYEVAAESRRMIAKGNTEHKTVLFSMAPEVALPQSHLSDPRRGALLSDCATRLCLSRIGPVANKPRIR